ncbi:MAG: hypothetical protein AB3N63_13940 [Puniceicoccaceae bacterium]
MKNSASYAVGGGATLGIGVGFFFLHTSPLAFVGCIMAGVGLGLMMAAIIQAIKGD